jgi:hypothetical protein
MQLFKNVCVFKFKSRRVVRRPRRNFSSDTKSAPPSWPTDVGFIGDSIRLPDGQLQTFDSSGGVARLFGVQKPSLEVRRLAVGHPLAGQLGLFSLHRIEYVI